MSCFKNIVSRPKLNFIQNYPLVRSAVGNYTAQFSPEWTVIIDIINVFIHRHLTGITTRHTAGTVDSGHSGHLDTVSAWQCLLAASCHNQQHDQLHHDFIRDRGSTRKTRLRGVIRCSLSPNQISFRVL